MYGLLSSSLQREEDLYRACLEVDDKMRYKERKEEKKGRQQDTAHDHIFSPLFGSYLGASLHYGYIPIT